ncbi:apolipoprotein N-acyltransferase [Lacibacter sediminis]|uniref:Apolipoprotein N-acyltransferase n=1 Tax=Lacibacter sediminis TaxID=2760713 RepID=A0A7G5XJW9_9BACT|nr:apolipoprotein N-acyltransferase [Lacibacter sediminis]QNA45772.1 apolipoprotein N-acyltransferase [Lacibacter sediminis]
MKKFQPILLSLLSGLLFFLAWPMVNITVAIFIAFIPLFIIEQKNYSGIKFFGLMYLALFTWNISTTWWIWNADMLGAWLAIIVNSLLMCIPLMGFRFMNKRFGSLIGYTSFVLFWMSFEYLHLQDWGLSWPWLTLGNVFAGRTNWIQWYEYTGTSGGTLWVLLVNVLLFRLLFGVRDMSHEVRGKKYEIRMSSLLLISALLALPIILSLLINSNRSASHPTSVITNQTSSNIVIVQPNIDPYEKLSTGTFEAQLQQLIRLSEQQIDSNTTLLVWPETALYAPNGFDETSLQQNFFLNPLFAFLKRHPKINLFTGIESYRVFSERISNDARPIDGTSNFYEVYNGSVLFDSTGPKQFYHKSMLVPGVETLPGFLKFLAPVFEEFGGTAGGYAKQEERTPINTTNGYTIAPAICYESIYGEYMSRYVRSGANIIAVITNDGWWGNTPGYKHHMLYGKLRAIETRKWVLRSANTGISCFIDPMGEIFQPQPWWVAASTKMHIPVNNQQTFFVRYGDLLSKLALILTGILILFAIYQTITGKQKKKM